MTAMTGPPSGAGGPSAKVPGGRSSRAPARASSNSAPPVDVPLEELLPLQRLPEGGVDPHRVRAELRGDLPEGGKEGAEEVVHVHVGRHEGQAGDDGLRDVRRGDELGAVVGPFLRGDDVGKEDEVASVLEIGDVAVQQLDGQAQLAAADVQPVLGGIFLFVGSLTTTSAPSSVKKVSQNGK